MKLRHLTFPSLLSILLLAPYQDADAQDPRATTATDSAEPKLSVAPNGTSVPMLNFGGRPALNVQINGQGPFAFVVDTGASQTVVEADLLRELSLPSSGDGSVIKEFAIGGARMEEVRVISRPLLKRPGQQEGPRGVLSGLSFPGYLLTFDFPRKQITLRRGALGEPNGKTIFAYESGEPPSVPVKLAGRDFHVHLDTGAPIAVALPTRCKAELPLDGELQAGPKARTPSGEFQIYQGLLKGDIQIGSYKLSGRQVLFSDAVPYPGATPQGQVGCTALAQLVVTLDSRNHRIELTKSPGTQQE